ncbi:MAG: DUF131 domain-containing protein [Archaeoglobaceae archaeon]|nr:DUF131 domain-containing protein [Archaeoglobales archaeon]MDI9642313.1 DUF131 domain-containing protein [Archaeoglobales archaeon]
MDLRGLFVGIALIVIGVTLLSLSDLQNVSYGALLLIGPIPVIVSSDVGLAILLLLICSFLLILLQFLKW